MGSLDLQVTSMCRCLRKEKGILRGCWPAKSHSSLLNPIGVCVCVEKVLVEADNRMLGG